DLILLTGDFITWEASPQEAVVRALSGLRAPFGVYGCLGNHEIWSHAEDSITALFEQVGIRILRYARTYIARANERLNLIGIDYPKPTRDPLPRQLILPGETNILLSHTPVMFDRAAALGVDFTLSGHTHGGQVALEFISPEIAPSRLVTPYVS